jgi:3'5'-cyclic nucleotide phosphodiesterase
MSVSKFIKRITSPSLVKLEDDSDHDFTIGINSDPLTVLGIIFSGVIHDADHRGVSNMQLSQEQPELGEKYRNKSVAEQNSLDLCWALLMEDRFVDLRDLLFTTQDELDRFRQVLVNTVLATDIFDAELNAQRKGRWDKAFNAGKHNKGGLSSKEFNGLRSMIVVEHIIQASDVSHTMQHWHVYRKWNGKLFREMFTAYKHGRMAKNPADFWYQGELGFFDNYSKYTRKRGHAWHCSWSGP